MLAFPQSAPDQKLQLSFNRKLDGWKYTSAGIWSSKWVKSKPKAINKKVILHPQTSQNMA